MVGDLRLPGASSARSFPLPWPQLHGESLTGILLWSFEGEPLPALRRKCIELPGNSFHNVLREDGRTPQEAIHAIPNFSYRVQNYTGKGFLCIGDSHRFIDPIFAYGVYFGIQEGESTQAIGPSFVSSAQSSFWARPGRRRGTLASPLPIHISSLGNSFTRTAAATLASSPFGACSVWFPCRRRRRQSRLQILAHCYRQRNGFPSFSVR